MSRPAELIRRYIRAKDDNRAYLMKRVFAETATLEMVNKSSALSFPARTEGLAEITETFIRRFAQKYENVYTFCLGPLPDADAAAFSCDWLLGMSEKDGGALRSGCGRYDWRFEPGPDGLVEHLTITIELIPPVAAAHLDPVMDWMAGLPYPWCPHATALAAIPDLADLRPIADHLRARAGGQGAVAAAG